MPRGARERERERDGRGGPGREGEGDDANGREPPPPPPLDGSAPNARSRPRGPRKPNRGTRDGSSPGFVAPGSSSSSSSGKEEGEDGASEPSSGRNPRARSSSLSIDANSPDALGASSGSTPSYASAASSSFMRRKSPKLPGGKPPRGAPRERRGRSPRAACRDDDVEGGRDAGTRARATRARPPASDPRGRGDGADVDGGGGGERAHREEVVDVRGRRTSRPPRRARWPVPFSRHERKRSVRDDFLAPGEGKTRRGPRRHPRVEDLAKLALGSDSRVTDPRIRPVKGIWKDLPLQRVLRLCRPPSLGHISSRSTRGRDHGRHDRLRHHDVRSRLRFPTPRRPRPARSTFPAVRSARPRPRSLSRGG